MQIFAGDPWDPRSFSEVIFVKYSFKNFLYKVFLLMEWSQTAEWDNFLTEVFWFKMSIFTNVHTHDATHCFKLGLWGRTDHNIFPWLLEI